MNFRILLILFLSLLLKPLLIGQTVKKDKRKTMIIASPMSILNKENPHISFGINREITDRHAIEFGLGIIVDRNLNKGEIGKKAENGFKLYLEPKLFVDNSDSSSFTAIQLYYLKYDYNRSRYKKNELEELVDYKVKTNSYGISLLFGKKMQKDNLYVECSGGFGFKLVEVDHNSEIPMDDLKGESKKSFWQNWPFSNVDLAETKGLHPRIELALRMRIGFMF